MSTRKTNRGKWIVAGYLFLYSFSIPWYLPKGELPKIWFGLPHWVIISLGATLAVALFTVLVIRIYWYEGEAGDEDFK